MTMIKSFLLAAGSASLLFLGACGGGGNQASAPTSPAPTSPTAVSPTTVATSPSPAAASGHEAGKKAGGGIVVESGAYHLELVPEKEGSVTHLDLFLQKTDSHESVANAKITAQVQLPDGSQKSADMTYDTEAKHYTAKVDSVAVGEYKVVVQSEIGSEKVNARFAFKQ
jgi:hypothetical protein